MPVWNTCTVDRLGPSSAAVCVHLKAFDQSLRAFFFDLDPDRNDSPQACFLCFLVIVGTKAFSKT